MTPIPTYLAAVATEHRTQLTDLYHFLQDQLPDATEKLSYGMPAFFVAGKPVIYFAAMKHHLGLYPTAAPIVHFADDLTNFKTSKGAIQLPYDQPLPTALIAQLVAFRVAEIQNVD
ncbi:iron chaperone [Levilactobacillus mulengensis]|uniref:iron chaperone n=1 Tax=Levilactobacillus mulengensis TaxID=2486025 RepID=UPI000F77CC17|nr:DUF1801 domain-containing protein [Levilactobacillus mulengensis]